MPYNLSKRQKMYIPIKRLLDILICLPLCIVLAPFMIIFAIIIKLDSSGPILFKQERVGLHKKNFKIWKFRTMRTDAPKDIPTHMLSNPEAHITKFGKWARKYSVDELPQLYQVLFTGVASLCGPRAALWNQYDLVLERDKYGANDVKPGITGWAQINGRDELEIPIKAKLDGEYVKNFGFLMDARCFFGTFLTVLRHDGVVEGVTGEMKKQIAYRE